MSAAIKPDSMSPEQFRIAITALGIYAVLAAAIVYLGATYNHYVSVSSVRLSADRGEVTATVEVAFKRPGRGYYDRNRPATTLSITSVSGPPYVWRDYHWDELVKFEASGAAAELSGPRPRDVFTFVIPLDASMHAKARKDGAVKVRVRWMGEHTKGTTVALDTL